jgi:hypothetical protein
MSDPYVFSLRLPSSFEKFVKACADKEGVSINQFLVSCVTINIARVLEMNPPYKFKSFIPKMDPYKVNPYPEVCPVQSGDHVLHKPSEVVGTVKSVCAKRDASKQHIDEALIVLDPGWRTPRADQSRYWVRPTDKPGLFWVRVSDLEPQKCCICGEVSGRCEHTHVRPRVGDTVVAIDDPDTTGTVMGFAVNDPYTEYFVQWADRSVWVPAPDLRVVHRPQSLRVTAIVP